MHNFPIICCISIRTSSSSSTKTFLLLCQSTTAAQIEFPWPLHGNPALIHIQTKAICAMDAENARPKQKRSRRRGRPLSRFVPRMQRFSESAAYTYLASSREDSHAGKNGREPLETEASKNRALNALAATRGKLPPKTARAGIFPWLNTHVCACISSGVWARLLRVDAHVGTRALRSTGCLCVCVCVYTSVCSSPGVNYSRILLSNGFYCFRRGRCWLSMSWFARNANWRGRQLGR